MAVDQPVTMWRVRTGRTIVVFVVVLLLVSCTAHSSDEPPHLSVQNSVVALAEQPVAERSGQQVERINYPVQGQADPSQNWGDLYLPGGIHKEKTVPMVVLVHGGAWHHSIGADKFSKYARAIAARGVAVYNIEYRRVGSGGGWPTTFTDVSSALDYVPQLMNNHAELSGRSEVVGHSAGAQLAVWASTRGAGRGDRLGGRPKYRPDRIVSLSGPLDMTYASKRSGEDMYNALGGPPSRVAARYAEVDPIQNIDTGIPVAAVHGTADSVVAWQNSQRYIQAVQQAGGLAGLHLMSGDTHGSFLKPGSAHYNDVLDIITQGM